MKPELKTKWIRALRSGKYKQGRGRLRTQKSSMCCLGVLCDITDPKGWNRTGRTWSYGPADTMITRSMMDQLGIDGGVCSRLACMNDGDKEERVKRHSFAQIADWIKANL